VRRRSVFSIIAALVLAAALVPVAAAKPPPDRIELPAGFAPEGITSDGGNRFWVGSLADGAIWQGSLQSGNGFVLVSGQAGSVAVGTEFEAAHQRLWVAGGPTGDVRVYDVRTGALLETYSFGSGGFLNDLVVHDGAVYVTDSFNPRLLVIPLGPGGTLLDPSEAFALPLGGDYVHSNGDFNLNGITDARSDLLAIHSARGELLRIDPETGDATLVDTGDAELFSGDGLEREGQTLYVVRNFFNLIAVLRADSSFSSATLEGTITDPDLDIPTTATVARGSLYAVNARFTTPPTPTTDYAVIQLPRKP
jgi:hypothetical protein